MKKLIFLSAILFVFFTSCRTNEGELTQTVIIEVFYLDNYEVESIPRAFSVWIFRDFDTDFDRGPLFDLFSYQRLTLTDGTQIESIVHGHTGWETGVYRYVFENIPNGNYFILVSYHLPYPLIGNYIGYRRIIVSEYTHETIQRFVFTPIER